MARQLESMVSMLRAFWEWLHARRCIIRSNLDGRLVSLIPNKLQKRVYRAMLKMAMAGLPIRIIVLKSRKMGCSTFIQALFYFIAHCYQHTGCQTLAHTDESTLDIFEIAARMYVEDPDWPSRPTAPSTHRLAFDEWDSDFSVRTFGGHYAASGANRPFVHISELAKAQGDEATVRSRMMSVTNSVPTTPFSIIVIESTANMLDASMEFKNRYQRAKHGVSGYTDVFSPWFEEETYRVPGAEIVGYDDEEIKLKSRFELDDEQLMWRRQKIEDDCNGEVVWFNQDYPATDDEAWQSPIGRVYGMLNSTDHDEVLDVPTLLENGYAIRRAVDWGGVDPFVCLWLAYCDKPAKPRFSIDANSCANTWREAMGYVWESGGRPKDASNHCPDAFRYGITHHLSRGHVHIFRELYIPMAAARGETVLEHAEQIKVLSPEPVEVTICDKSAPGSITFFNNHGLPSVPYHYPERIRNTGEIIDGVKYVQALMKGNYPLAREPRKPTWLERSRAIRAGSPVSIGYSGTDTSVRMANQRRSLGGRAVGGGSRGLDGYL